VKYVEVGLRNILTQQHKGIGHWVSRQKSGNEIWS